MDDSIVARFWQRVEPGHPDSCWVFKKSSGEPCTQHTAIFSGDGPTRSKIFAHRLSYILHKGEIPSGLYVRHMCDNPPCVNPDHLVLGTHLENIQDMIIRNRGVRGERVGGASLIESQVIEMRMRYAMESVSMKSLAEQYGVTLGNVSAIINRKTWKHI